MLLGVAVEKTAALEQPFTVNFRTSFSPEAVTFVFAGLGIVGADTYSAKVRSSRNRDGRCEKRSARDSIDNGLTPDVEEGKNPFCIPSFPETTAMFRVLLATLGTVPLDWRRLHTEARIEERNSCEARWTTN
jgi:hypothetical protein